MNGGRGSTLRPQRLDDASRYKTKQTTMAAFLFVPFGKLFHSLLVGVRQHSNLFGSIYSFNGIDSHEFNGITGAHSVFNLHLLRITQRSKGFMEKLRDLSKVTEMCR